MKRIGMMILLAVLLTAAPCALAQLEGAASTAQRTDLLNAPVEDAQVLMQYYPGVRVEVLREADSRYVQVNVGVKGGSLTGYMKKDDLVFGEENVRLNRPLEVCYEQQGWTMYSYPDTRAEVLVERSDTYLYVMGEYGDWVHAVQSEGSTDITGFVSREDDALSEMNRSSCYAYSIRTEPTGSEPTREEAIERAKAYILADGVYANGTDEPATQAMLDACSVSVEYRYEYDAGEACPLWYGVIFYYPDRSLESGDPMIYALCCLYVEDGEIVTYDYGKG